MVDNIGITDTYYRVIIAVESTTNDVIKLNLNDTDFIWFQIVPQVEIQGTEHYGAGKYDLYVGVYNDIFQNTDIPVSSLRQVMLSLAESRKKHWM